MFFSMAALYTVIGVWNDIDGAVPRNWTMFVSAALFVLAGFQ
jgi:hypothetical protein